MVRRFIYWTVSAFFSILPYVLLIIFNEKKEDYLVKITATSPEVIYTIVVLSGLTMYDLITVADRALRKRWWGLSFLFFAIWEVCGACTYGGFVAYSSANNNGTSFLERMFPYSMYVALAVLVLGTIVQLKIGRTEEEIWMHSKQI